MHVELSVLWERLRKGDQASLKEIYNQEADFLFNYGKKIFQDSTLVEDSIHDLFVELWLKRKNLGPTTAIRPYLATSLRRRIVHQLKKMKTIDFIDNHESVQFQAELSVDDLIITQEIGKEKAEKLQAAIKQLTNREREIVYLKYYQGMDYDEIESITGIRYQSLRNIMSKAIKKLKGALTLIIFGSVFILKTNA